MNRDSVKKKIEDYLSSTKRYPLVVDFSSRIELELFKELFHVGTNIFVSAERFCQKDGTFKFEELEHTIDKNEGTIFIVCLSAFLRLQGTVFAKKELKKILSKNINGHVILLTYMCSGFLSFSDTRFKERGQVVCLNDIKDDVAGVCLVAPDLAEAFPNCFVGFEKIGEIIETSTDNPIYIATDVKKSLFDKSIFAIAQMRNGYDIVCDIDPRTKGVAASYGSAKQWNYLLKLIARKNWDFVIKNEFGADTDLAGYISQYAHFSEEKKWLYYISLMIFGTQKCEYLQHAVFNAANYQEFIKSLFRVILTIDYRDIKFQKYYTERKEILSNLIELLSESADYCKVVSIKGENLIYYLTDLTIAEKEKIIEWLDKYGENYTAEALIKILHTVYPDLAEYLASYRFKNELLDKYFDLYKYQKVINKILPSFEAIVDEQAHDFNFVDVLPSRTAIVDKVETKGTQVYFLDALGAEYLSFIQAKCNKYGLSANISIGRCELPSLTYCNCEFVNYFEGKGCHVANIKDLDDIKHHGENSFDYEKVKTPIYLIKELEIINDLLIKISSKILSGEIAKAIVISDHGASRLAVIHETENMWQMETVGEHSGRCCPKNEINSKPECAIESDGFWVLANYDRFRGGRKANVEVHGGASLEEVTIPIIEIIRKPGTVEAFVVEESKIIILAPREYPTLKIYVGLKSNDISIKIGNRFYEAKKTSDDFIYTVELTDCTKRGRYCFDIYNGSDIIASGLEFEVKKKGMTEVGGLFD